MAFLISYKDIHHLISCHINTLGAAFLSLKAVVCSYSISWATVMYRNLGHSPPLLNGRAKMHLCILNHEAWSRDPFANSGFPFQMQSYFRCRSPHGKGPSQTSWSGPLHSPCHAFKETFFLFSPLPWPSFGLMC